MPAIASPTERTPSPGIGETLTSPSGAYEATLERSVEERQGKSWSYARPVLQAPDGADRYASPVTYALWFDLKVAWDATERLWVTSGDIGTHIYFRHDGAWTRAIWRSDGPETPSPDHQIWDAQVGGDVPILGGRRP